MSCCTSTQVFGNTGVSASELIIKDLQMVVFMPKYDSNRVLNKIEVDNPATLGATLRTLTSATTTADKRLYPFQLAENVTQEKSERQMQAAPSLREYKLQDGVRSIAFDLLDTNSSFRLLGELQKFGCKDWVYFYVDNCGNFWGGKLDGIELHGIPVMKNTFDPQNVRPVQGTSVNAIRVMFKEAFGFNDSGMMAITAETLGYSATELEGIVTVNATVGAITTTSVIVDLWMVSNDATAPQTPFTGLGSGYFSLAELEPTPASITVATAVESLVTPGKYTLTFASQTSADILEGTATRGGFEVKPFRFVIP